MSEPEIAPPAQDTPAASPPVRLAAPGAPRGLLVLHGVWLVWTAGWCAAMEEVRASVAGRALFATCAWVVVSVAATEVLRRRASAAPARATRPPRFTAQVLAGLVAIACGAFCLVEAFYLDLPDETFFTVFGGAGPVSRWVFMVGGVIVPTLVYGAAVIAMASGLTDRPEPPPPAPAAPDAALASPARA
jgi:hypothetical protein